VDGDPLPDGVQGFDAGGRGDHVFWLAEHRALVTGDFERREGLRPLLGLDVELIFPSRGEPVLAGGAEALRVLLAG
jgi:hypothetical protein